MAKKITPLGDRIVVKPQKEEAEKPSVSGFIVASKKDENPHPKIGTVLEIGPKVEDISIGDEVVFKEFIPTSFELNEEKYLILAEEDILAKLS